MYPQGQPIFGSTPPAGSTGPIVSGPNSPATGGDIHIHNYNPRNPKKALLIIGIVISIIVAVVAIVIITTSSNGKSQLGSASAETSFKTFAQYIIYGDEAGNLDEAAYSYSSSAIAKAVEARDSDYFTKASELYNDFLSKYNNNVPTVASQIYSNLNTLAVYSRVNFQDASQGINYYAEYDHDQMKAQVEEDLKALHAANAVNANPNAIYDALSEYLNTGIEYYQEMENQGCIRNKQISKACVSDADLSDEMTQKIASANAALGRGMKAAAEIKNSLIDEVEDVMKGIK